MFWMFYRYAFWLQNTNLVLYHNRLIWSRVLIGINHLVVKLKQFIPANNFPSCFSLYKPWLSRSFSWNQWQGTIRWLQHLAELWRSFWWPWMKCWTLSSSQFPTGECRIAGWYHTMTMTRMGKKKRSFQSAKHQMYTQQQRVTVFPGSWGCYLY